MRSTKKNSSRLRNEWISFWTTLKEFTRPLPREYPFYAIALLAQLTYWVLAFHFRPGESLADLILYRSRDGDIQYLPLICSEARGNFGDGELMESLGKGVVTFPYFMLAPFSIPIHFFGDAGWIVADVLIGFSFFLTVRAWCLLYCRNPLWSSAIACALASGLSRLMPRFLAAFLVKYPFLAVWGDRIPRPFVTDWYLLLSLLIFTALALSRQNRRQGLLWSAAGVMVAIAIQSNFYNFISLFLTLPLLFFLFLRDFAPLREWGRSLAWFIGGGLATGWPWFYQRAYEQPINMRWMGIYPLSRMDGWRHHDWFYSIPFALLLFALALLILPRFLRPASAYPVPPPSLPQLAIPAWAGAMAWMGPALLAMLSGSTVQPNHFQFTLEAIEAFVWLAVFAWYAVNFRAFIPVREGDRKPSAPPSDSKALFVGLLLGCLLILGAQARRVREWIRYEGPVRLEETAGPGYRSNFTALTAELSRPRYRDCQAIATLNHQVLVWWVALQRRYAFCPDLMATTAGQPEIECRFALFCHQLNLTPDQFHDLIGRQLVLNLWLSGNEYQLSPMHHFAPLSDYSSQALADLQAIPYGKGNWNLILPLSEEQRLMELYRKTAEIPLSSYPRFDLIVLHDQEGWLPHLEGPVSADWELAYSNDDFRVWIRRPSAASALP